jgi:hypothetical protein
VRQRKTEQVRIPSFDATKNICIFATYRGEETHQELVESIDYLKKRGKNVSVFYFFDRKKTPATIPNNADVHIICKKDVSFTGLLSSPVQKEVKRLYHHFFIDVDRSSDTLALYIKTLINADLRIGRNKKQYSYYDLTFCIDEKYTIKEYITNLETYIKKLQGN